MTTHYLLALVFAVSCFALSACNVGGTGVRLYSGINAFLFLLKLFVEAYQKCM